ncbi:hypothetical protein DRN85_03595 [Methanosarcinales archaeon]|nr:MAG: hypothetical protein DRN85_03595 [Methanosarcinales archaeon]
MKSKIIHEQRSHKYSLYPASKRELAEPVSERLKSIEYCRWSEFYWKITRIIGNREHRTIDGFHDTIANNKQIQRQIEKIRVH